MKRLTILFLSLSFLSCSQLMSPQSKGITKKYFPELEIEINTPAFEKKKGFTTHEELLTFVNKLQSEHPDIVSIQYIGSSQKGKQIPMVLFHKNKLSESNSKVIEKCPQKCLKSELKSDLKSDLKVTSKGSRNRAF